jgi:hypothetical protein
MPEFTASTFLPASPAEVYNYHARPGALQRLLPPWQPVEIVRPIDALRDGAEAELALRLGLWRLRWVAEHRDTRPGESFCDVQRRGPFATWEHQHRFVADGDGCRLEDEIRYRLPGGFLGALVGESLVRRTLARTFRFRHARTARDLARQRLAAHRPRLRLALSGASGLIGRALSAFLTTAGHQVVPLVRRTPPPPGAIFWDPTAGVLDGAALAWCDAVVHLAGENIAAGRWTAASKERIRVSRVAGTRLIAETLAHMPGPPRTLIAASAVGYYGNCREEVDEDSPPGEGFLAQVCRQWEDACEPARRAGVRVVNLRMGVVLSAGGGALARMLPLFRLGLGGRLGSGRQVMSWISLDDVVGLIHHLLFSRLAGPVNATAPAPVSNADFTRTLARVLRRPAPIPVPAAALRLALGEMGEALLLQGAPVLPRRAEADGFTFLDPTLEAALRFELGR